MGRSLLRSLNRESVAMTADPPTPNDDLDITIGVPTLQEVTQAIQQMKSGKVPGTDNIWTEMLKTVTDLFRNI